MSFSASYHWPRALNVLYVCRKLLMGFPRFVFSLVISPRTTSFFGNYSNYYIGNTFQYMQLTCIHTRNNGDHETGIDLTSNHASKRSENAERKKKRKIKTTFKNGYKNQNGTKEPINHEMEFFLFHAQKPNKRTKYKQFNNNTLVMAVQMMKERSMCVD